MLRTIGVKRLSCFLMTTLSRKYFVEAGRTSPDRRLMAIKTKPSARSPRRGLISAQTSGKDFQAFFRFSPFVFFEGSCSGAISVSDYLRLLDAAAETLSTCGGLAEWLGG